MGPGKINHGSNPGSFDSSLCSRAGAAGRGGMETLNWNQTLEVFTRVLELDSGGVPGCLDSWGTIASSKTMPAPMRWTDLLF